MSQSHRPIDVLEDDVDLATLSLGLKDVASAIYGPSWAEMVEAEMHVANAGAAVPTESHDACWNAPDGSPGLLHQVSMPMRISTVPTSRAVLGHSSMLKSAESTSALASDDKIFVSHGIPYGEDVYPMTITDAQILKSTSANVMQVAEQLQLMDDSTQSYGPVEITTVAATRRRGSQRECQLTVAEIDSSFRLTIALHELDNVWWYDGCSLTGYDPDSQTDYDVLNTLLSAVQLCTMNGTWRPSAMTNLHHGSLRSIKHSVVRSESSATRKMAKSTAPAHALARTGRGEIDLTCLVDVSHRTYTSCIAYGRVAAGDVPASPIVVLSANGGKTVTGSVAVVTGTSKLGRGYVIVHVTAATANMPLLDFQQSLKFAPTVRDSVSSAVMASALHYDDGMIASFDGDGNLIKRTATIMRRAESEIVLATADPVGVKLGLRELAHLGKFKYRCEGPLVRLTTSTQMKTVRLHYDPACSVPKWHALIQWSGDIMPATSEECMDYGLSGVGRYLCRDVLEHGKVTTSLRLNRASPHYELAKAQRALVKSGDMAAVDRRTFVVDMEYMTRSSGSGTAKVVERYVYAIGIAEVTGGRLVAMCNVVDSSKTLHDFVAANPKAAARELTNWQKLLADPDVEKGEVHTWLEWIRNAANDPLMRMYGKGVDNDNAILAGEYDDTTRLFKTQADVHDIVREFGGLVPKFEVLDPDAQLRGHNPGLEVTAFAKAAGFIKFVDLNIPKLKR